MKRPELLTDRSGALSDSYYSFKLGEFIAYSQHLEQENKELRELLELALKRSTDETLRHLIKQALKK